jgi:hypothetical protein
MAALRWSAGVAGLLLSLSAHAQTPDPDAQWSLPTSGLLNGSMARMEAKPCCAASGGGAPVDQSDAAAMAAAQGMASRNGTTLSLKLADNHTLTLSDCVEASGCSADNAHVHRLVAWWPTHELFVVSVSLYEASVAYLVSARSGRTLMTTAPPVLSPSGQFAIALTSNLMEGMELQLIDLRANPPTLAKITNMPQCKGIGPDTFLRPTPVWIDGSRVRFEGVSPQPGDLPNTRQLLRIADGKAVWEC